MRRRFRRLGLGLLGLHLLVAAPCLAAPFEDHEVKAALLLKILRFVDWPAATFDEQNEFVACGLGRDELSLELATRVPKEGVAGRSAIWRELDPAALVSDSSSCHFLYFASEEASQLRKWNTSAQRQPILLIGAWPGFLEAGGMLNFLTEEKKVRFEVHLERAHRHRLELSAKVLALASRVLTEFAPG